MDVFGFNILAEDKTGPAVQSAVAGTTKLEAAQKRLGAAIKTGSREMTLLASGLTHLGMTAMLATPFLGGLGEGIGQAGLVLATFGSGISTVVPLLQTMKVVLYGDLIPAVIAYTSALWAAYAAEIVVTGGIALVLGAIAGYYLLTQKAGGAQVDLNTAVVTGTGNMGDYKDEVKDTVYWTERLKGLSRDLTGASIEHQVALLDEAEAQKKYDYARFASPEKAQAFFELQRAHLRVQATAENVETIEESLEAARAWSILAGHPMIGGVTMSPADVLTGGIYPTIASGGGVPQGTIGQQQTSVPSGGITFIIDKVQLSPSDTLLAWQEREFNELRKQRGIPT